MNRYASIYKRRNLFLFVPVSRTTVGLGRIHEPCIVVDEGAPDHQLGEALRSALARSREGIPHPYPEVGGRTMPGHVLVEAAGVKSYSTFVKGAVSASALDHGETIRLVPDENRGVRKGFVPLSDLDMLLLSTCQDDELGAAVREVISRST